MIEEGHRDVDGFVRSIKHESSLFVFSNGDRVLFSYSRNPAHNGGMAPVFYQYWIGTENHWQPLSVRSGVKLAEYLSRSATLEEFMKVAL